VKTQRPTQSDVARLANVSPAVVSAVVNGSNAPKEIRISDETRQRVIQAIAELGYAPNAIAQKLARGHSHIISVFTYEAVFPTSSQNYYFPYLEGIEQEAVARDYDMLLCTRAVDSNGRRAVYRNGISSLQIGDGAILLGRPDDQARRDDLPRLLRERYPFVFIGRREIAEGPIAYVAPDAAQASKRVTEHVIANGHTHIAYIGRSSFNESFADRERGFRTALYAAGLTVDESIFIRTEPERVTTDSIRALLARQPTAVIAEDGELAVPLLNACRLLGVQIPDDLSFALVGDSLAGQITEGIVTSFQIPRTDIGARAVRMLLTMLNSSDPTFAPQEMVECRFIPGTTVIPITTNR